MTKDWLKEEDSVSKPKKLQCPACKKKFDTIGELRDHINEKHPRKD